MLRMTSLIARFCTLAVVSCPVAAVASQGPGGGPGTASQPTQIAMAIAVYGGCALTITSGLIGGLRSRAR